MGSDAIVNVPLSAFVKDSTTKKKKGNRLCKLKQNKVDVRIEPWLSQAKNNGCKVATDNSRGAPPSPIPKTFNGRKTQDNLSIRAREDKHQRIFETFDSDALSWMHRKSSCDGLGKDLSGSRSSCSGSCSSSSFEEEKDNDWEAVANALTADCNKRFPDVEPNTEPGGPDRFHSRNGSRLVDKKHNISNLKSEATGIARQYQGNCRAWRPDDVYRPRNLPSLSKQHTLIQNTGRCFYQEPTVLSWKRVESQQPSSCPICCEDFDETDSSFLPCPCGFRLCLFCHKRIVELDGRCPGCRKHYNLADLDGASVVEPVALKMSHPSSKNKRN